MKKFINLFFIIALVMIGFTSCEEKEEAPGEIPGMGNTPGELEIKEPFVAPEGIEISIQSEDEVSLGDIISGQTQLKSTQFSWSNIMGCGGSLSGNDLKFWVKVKLNIQNTSSHRKCFNLPSGLVFKVSDEDYQHGIVISPISICIEGNCWWHKSIVLMCINKGKDGSSKNVTYSMAGVTSSHQMWRLLNRIKNKKVNIGFYTGDSPSAQLKSANALGLEKYKEVADHIQNAIWTITNDGVELTEEQVSYFESLPDIDE